MTGERVRWESDLLGELEIPADAYYGIHTARALANFRISGTPISAYPDFVSALAAVKAAAAWANHSLGQLSGERADAIVAACEEIRAGALHDQFVVDAIQGGAGTSTNMNANEVICNRALELLGHARGDYHVLHPLDHVNLGQSTNDVYPTAVKLALHVGIERLVGSLGALREAFERKAAELADVVKMGRTQLRDAVPITLGQELGAYAVTLAEEQDRLRESMALLREINLGATAIGTGINAHPDYAPRACAELARLTGIAVETAPNLVEATQDAGAFVQTSGALKRTAVKLSKICSDLRLLSSGPAAGLAEITLPAVQGGSSIMPGKVNPVIPEVVNQVAFEVIGFDVTVTLAAEGGQLQLNAFEPIIARSLFEAVAHLRAGCDVLTERCVAGITANRERALEGVVRSPLIATALSPELGYATTTEIVSEAVRTGRTVYELILERGLLTRERLDELLAPERLLGRVAPTAPAAPAAPDAVPGN